MTLRLSVLAPSALAALLLANLIWQLQATPHPRWQPMATKSPLAVSRAPIAMLPDLSEQYRAVSWEQPLFSPQRRPDPTGEPAGVPATTFSLGGVVITSQGQWAWLRAAGGKPIRAKLGVTLEGGWTLTHITPTSATLSRSGKDQIVQIPAARLPLAPPAPATPHTDARLP